MMIFFVIAHKDKEHLNSPVFHAGQDGKQEAVAVFTRKEEAERYIADAGWGEQFEVGKLRPIQLLKWFVAAHEDGCSLVAVDPDRAAQKAGTPQQVVDLNEPLTAFADSLHSLLTQN